MSGLGKTLQGAFAALAALALAGIAQAVDNTGTGGTITYTDASGLNPVASPPYLNGFVVHKFTASGSLNVPVPAIANAVVVGGGGGGGRFGGGGGAGGYLFSTAVAVSSGDTAVTIGAGGAGTATQGAVGVSGGNSIFGSLTALGGGGGGSRTGANPAAGVNGAAGGSGGGASASDSGAKTGGAGTSGQGNAGGNQPSGASTSWGSGGGGGAGALGGNASGVGGSSSGGKGGDGLSNNITGTAVFYAGGGGGGTYSGASTGTAGAGGNGGGGAGIKADGTPGTPGTANTGGGGGGGGLNASGGAGGDGIVIVKYPYDAGSFSVAVTAPANGQSIVVGPSITASASVFNGTSYSVTFYLQTNGGGFTQVGSPGSTSPYAVNLGSLAVGTYDIYASATDTTFGTVTSATNTFTVVAPTLVISPTTVPDGRSNVSYAPTTITTSGGTAPYTYDLSAGTLPSGMTLSTGGLLSGTPVTAATYNFTVRATDSFSYTGTHAYTMIVQPAGPLTSVWTQTAGNAQSWTTGGNWSGGIAPNPIAGDTMDFSTVNIAANTTLTLGADRTAEIWKFGDTSGAQTWTVNAGNKMILAGTTPTINVLQNTVTLSNVVDGTAGLTKTGPGTLTLTATNTFSGDLVINAGAMDNLTASTLGTGTNITFSGSGTLSPQYGNSPVIAKGITVNPGVTATLNVPNQFYNMTFSGAVSGSGTLAVICSDNGKGTVTFSNATNAFTGALRIGSATLGATLNVNSLADGANPIQIYRDTAGDAALTPFTLAAGTASSLLFNSRQIELMGATTGATINNNNATATITINTPLKVTGVGNKTLTLGGANTGANTFGGAINDASGSVISLTKAGAGKWTLSAANTYTGNTTISAGTLVPAESTGGLSFKVTDTTANKVTGAGTATLNGSFTIDTTAVTVGAGSSWTLVDVATKTYGPNFSVTGFTGPDSGGLWKQVNGSQIWFFNPATGILFLSAPGEIAYFGIPGYSGVIDQTLKTIDLTVPYTPYGSAGLASLAPNFTLSSGTCNQTSGSPPSPTFAAANPVHYIVTDGATTNDYTVTVSVTPAATGNVMSNIYFPGHGYAWAGDNTESDPFSLLMVVPAATDVTALAPTFTLSQFATVDVPSGTPRNFTSAKTYTVTGEDGSTQIYTVAVQKLTATGTGTYQGKVLASGPVSYWPLNETSGTTAADLAAGINPITFADTYILNSAGLRPDGNPSVDFTTITGTTGTATPGNPVPASLNAKEFTVECWVKPNNTTVQYLVSLQDRTAGGRIGYALWKNNGSTGFGVMAGIGTASTGVSVNGATVAEVGKSYHVVGTYDGTTLKLYVNGNLEGSTPLTYVPATFTQPGFSIGSRNGATGADSNIQDVAVYTRALTQAEIQAHTGYRLTYSGNGNDGGTVPSASVIGYASGDTVTVLGNTGSLTKTGFTYSGWNTQANGSGTTYQSGDTFAISADTTLYAKWTAPGYASWQTLNGATGQGLNLDHDNDGVSNGIEYFIGGPNGNTTGFTALPGVTNEGGGMLSVTYIHAADYLGIYGTDYVVEVSDTLGSWIPAPTGVTFPVSPANSVKYTFPAGARNFARLNVTGP